jgi:serine phosphatase RsbU (regulator of sigma subunit)
MLEALLSALFFIALGMPVMIIVTESFRIVKNVRFFLLADLYLILVANEVLFTALGADFYYYHVLIDCVLITFATAIYADSETPELRYPRRFVPGHIIICLGLIACTARFIVAPGEVNFIVGVNLVLVCFINGWILFRSLEDGLYAFLAILSFWLLMHFGKYSQPDWINALLTLAFFGTVAVYTGVQLLMLNKKTLAENNLLIKARDVVLAMLNDISSSMNNLSSVDFTLNRVLETILETLGVEGAAIYALDREMPEAPILRFSQASGLFWPMHAELDQVFTRQAFMKEHLEKTIYRVGEGVVGLVAQKKEMCRLERAHDADEMKRLGLNPRNIRNVLAVPLKVKEQILGVLVVQNRKAEGVFNLNDTHLLQALADQAGLSINNVHMYAELAKTDRLRQEMNIASDMQRQLLPTAIPSAENLSIAAYIRPAKEVGGDYYDFVENTDKSLGIVIGDVSGKGLPAGLIMVMAKTVLQIVARDESNAKTIVSQFAREMYPKMHRGQFMTLNYLLWQPKTRTLHCAGAGHEHILWYHKDNDRALDKIRAGGMAVGLIEDPTALIKEHALTAAPGDVFLLYTDGITEARNKKDELFTLKRLMSAFEQCAPLSNPDLICERIIGTINEFSEGIDQYDDITLVVLSVVS